MHVRGEDDPALRAQNLQRAVFLHIGDISRIPGLVYIFRKLFLRKIALVRVDQFGLWKGFLDFLQKFGWEGTAKMYADDFVRDDLLPQEIQDAARLPILGKIRIEQEIFLILFEQVDEIRPEEHPGLHHIPIQLLGDAIDHFFPVVLVAGFDKIPKGLDDVDHIPHQGSGNGVGSPVVVVEGLGDVTDPRVTGNQGGNQGDVLKQHFFVLVFFPDGPPEELVDAIGDVVPIGNIVG